MGEKKGRKIILPSPAALALRTRFAFGVVQILYPDNAKRKQTRTCIKSTTKCELFFLLKFAILHDVLANSYAYKELATKCCKLVWYKGKVKI